MLGLYKYIQTTPFSKLSNWSVQQLIETTISFNAAYQMVRIGNLLQRNKIAINVQDNIDYKRITIRLRNGGVILRDVVQGQNIGTKRQFLVSEGQFILSKIDARNGAMGIIPSELEGAIVTQDFLAYDIDKSRINPIFLLLISTTKEFISLCQSCSSGTTNRQRIEETKFLDIKIPLPTIEEQDTLVEEYNNLICLSKAQEIEAERLKNDIQINLFNKLGVQVTNSTNIPKGLQFVSFKNIQEWGVEKITNKNNFSSSLFTTISLGENQNLIREVFRGKSPKYDEKSSVFILNQKCVRWNNIELKWAKKINENWIRNINRTFFTKEGDILINSTGEGTIGRSSVVSAKHEGLLYDSHVLLLRLDKTIINPTYFSEIFNSAYGQTQIDIVKSAQSTKQTELGINNLLKIEFPLPPLNIQIEIVSYINEIKSHIDQLQANADNNKITALNNFEHKIFK